MHPLIGLIQLLAIGFAVYVLSLIVWTMWALTHPHRQTYASAVSRNLPGDPGELDEPLVFEERTVEGRRGRLHLWDIAGRDPGGATAIMTHGWGSSRQGGLKRLGPVVEHASRVILWDLPGHGDSEGATHLGADEYNDGVRVVEELCDPGEELVLVGWSMGAGVSIAMARELQHRYRILGLVCEAPYLMPSAPARNVIRLKGVPHRLNLSPAIALLGVLFGVGPRWRGFNRRELAGDIEAPLLVLHGSEDPVCPLPDARLLAAAAKDGRFVSIEGGGHNNLWTEQELRVRMSEHVGRFMRALARSSSQSGAPARP